MKLRVTITGTINIGRPTREAYPDVKGPLTALAVAEAETRYAEGDGYMDAASYLDGISDLKFKFEPIPEAKKS